MTNYTQYNTYHQWLSRLVLCPASPDCDLTPPLEGTSTVSHLPNSTIVSSTAIRSTITIPERYI